MRRRALLALVLLAPAALAAAEPFGLKPGMSRAEIEARTGALREIRPFVFLATEVPESYPELATYSLFVTPEHGLCRIQATSEVIRSAGNGQDLRERFERLMERLWEAYGSPEVVDRLSVDSSFKGEDEWMVALFEHERALMTLWTEAKGSELSEGLASVVLSARALKPEEGYLNVDYTFDNWDRCQLRYEAGADGPR